MNASYLYDKVVDVHTKVEIEGLTGLITFDRGRRMDFSLDILQLQSTGLKKVTHCLNLIYLFRLVGSLRYGQM